MKRVSLNKVMAKLAEEQRFELSIVQDVKDQINYADDSWTRKLDAAGDALVKAYQEIDMAEEKYKFAIEKAEDGIRKAKELGADDIIKDLERGIKISKERMARVKTIKSAIDKLPF
jgi:hypothetical protein